MAVVTTKSATVTNRDATPRVFSNARVAQAEMKEAVGFVEAVNGDSIASKYIFASVPSNARVSQVLLSCDAIAVSGAGDIGIYKSVPDGGTVVDADFFASAQVVTAALVNSDVTHEADAADAGAGFGLADCEKPLWEALGLSADPGIWYDVVMTLTTATGGAGTIGLKVRYGI